MDGITISLSCSTDCFMLDCYHLAKKDATMSEKILIIDDDLDTLRLVGLMLQRQGYQIIAASNGTQGLEKALEEYPGKTITKKLSTAGAK